METQGCPIKAFTDSKLGQVSQTDYRCLKDSIKETQSPLDSSLSAVYSTCTLFASSSLLLGCLDPQSQQLLESMTSFKTTTSLDADCHYLCPLFHVHLAYSAPSWVTPPVGPALPLPLVHAPTSSSTVSFM
jgi:hypothetical protein